MTAAFHHKYSSPRTLHTRQGNEQQSQRNFGCLANPALHTAWIQSDPWHVGNGKTHPRSSVALGAISSSDLDGGVFSTEDIVVGLILGVVLALMASFLQGRRSQNDFVLWNKETSSEDMKLTSALPSAPNTEEMEPELAVNSTAQSESSISDLSSVQQESRSMTVFDGDDWKEMSRPENYVYYNRNLNKKKEPLEESEQTDEQKWVIAALLALFVPIFSVEFFFALSRQVLCSGEDNGLLSSLEAAQYLCSPVR